MEAAARTAVGAEERETSVLLFVWVCVSGVLVSCAREGEGSGGRWEDGWEDGCGQRRCVCVPIHVCVYERQDREAEPKTHQAASYETAADGDWSMLKSALGKEGKGRVEGWCVR